MAGKGKGKGKSSRKKIDKKGATDVGDSAPMLIPPSRDLKHHIAMIQIARAKHNKSQQELTAAYKAADQAGIMRTAIDRGLALHKKDPLTAKSEMLQMAMVLNELGSAVQFEVYDPKNKGPEGEAKVRGYQDGKAGREKDYGSWIKGSPARLAYDEAYDAGQLENMPIDLASKRKLQEEGAAAH
jgi:hypothetical protein